MITDAMVERARNAYMRAYPILNPMFSCNPDAMRAALEAALSSSPPVDAALIHDNLYDALGMLDKAVELIEETRRLARLQAPLK